MTLSTSVNRRHASVVLLGLVGSIVHAVWWPPNHDLASHAFRIDLFRRAPFAVWNNDWFAGHHTPAYSVLVPLLGSAIGVRVLGVLSVVMSSWFGSILTHRAATVHPSLRRPTIAAGLLVVGCLASLVLGRDAFLLGLAFGLLAVVLATGDGWRPSLTAGAGAVLAGLASPVAAVFVAMFGASFVLTHLRSPDLRRRGASLVLGALVPVGFVTLWFPEGGDFPFPFGGLVNLLLTTALIGILGRRHRLLVWMCGLYSLASIASLMLGSPMGGNITRLAAFAGPAAVVMVWPERVNVRYWLLVPLALMVTNQWAQVRPLVGLSSAQTTAAFYEPLLQVLAKQQGPIRVEVVPVASHGEAQWVANTFPIARGWDRQLDRRYNAVLFGAHLEPAEYLDWLRGNGVSFVALANTQLDAAGKQEAALLANAPSYLQEIYSDDVWTVWSVTPRPSLVDGAATLTSVDVDAFTVDAPKFPAEAIVKVHFSPWMHVTSGSGCVREGPDGWTAVTVVGGPVRVTASVTLRGLLHRGGDC